MDSTAISLCRDNKLPIVVFDLRHARQHQARRRRASRSARWCTRRGGRPAMVNDVVKDLEGGIDKAHDVAQARARQGAHRPRQPRAARRRPRRLLRHADAAQPGGVAARRPTRGSSSSSRGRRSCARDIEKAIRKAELGINPQRRRGRAPARSRRSPRSAAGADKVVKRMGEDGTVAIRNVAPRRQRDAQGVSRSARSPRTTSRRALKQVQDVDRQGHREGRRDRRRRRKPRSWRSEAPPRLLHVDLDALR